MKAFGVTLSTRSLISFTVAALVSVVLWSPGLGAKWGIIDDHEIQLFIGPSERMSLSQLIPNLLKTEVGNPGVSLRYRPGYYVARLLECAVWGKHPAMWYGFRLALFAAALSIFIALFARAVGLPLALAGALVILCNSYWADIFARLGPAETYAVFGLSLYCVAFSVLRRQLMQRLPDSGSRRWVVPMWAWTIAAASLLTAGSKENFTLLIVPSVYLLYVGWRRRRSAIDMLALAGLLINVLIPAAIVIAVVLAVHAARMDIYANPVGLGERFRLLVVFVRHASPPGYLLLCVSFLVGAGAIAGRCTGLDAERRRLLTRGVYIQLSLVALYVSQFLFYNGRWPTRTRYDFPGAMLPWIAAVLAIDLASRSVPRRFATAIRLAGLALLCGTAFQERGWLARNRDLSRVNAVTTQVFTREINDVIRQVSRHPERGILLESHSPWDYEPAISVVLFLRAGRINNAVQIRVMGYSSANYPPESLEYLLATDLERFSRSGDTQIGFAPFQSGASRMYTLGLSGDPSGAPYQALYRIY